MKLRLAICIAVVSAATGVTNAAATGTAKSGDACATELRKAIVRRWPASVSANCWRVGPIRLGMSEVQVERRIGRPVTKSFMRPSGGGASSQRPLRVTLHVFSAVPGPVVRDGRAQIRLVELRYSAGRLIAIDNAPATSMTADRCHAPSATRHGAADVDLGARAGPLLRFQGVGVGDPLSVLRRRFGALPSANRSRDWYTYLPVPISFDADPGQGTIVGFAVAADEETLTTSTMPMLHLKRDPATCRLTSIGFALKPS